MSVFFVYTGLEVGAGQWEASFCRGHLNLSAGATGLAVFGYWGALTAVRIGLAVLPRPVPPQAVVRWGSALAVIAAAVASAFSTFARHTLILCQKFRPPSRAASPSALTRP